MKAQRIIIAILVCLVFLCLVFWPHHKPKHGGGFERSLRFSKIGNAIEKFTWDHRGQLPAKLSDLVPRYISRDQQSVFYPPEMLIPSTKSLPPDWDHKPELTDTLSDCVYLGATGVPCEVIAYERDGKWNHAPTAKRQIIPPSGGVYPVTKLELEELLHTNRSAVLERMRKERVVYYEANLHASLNSYRIDVGTYPRGDNASVTRVLRGENPARKQYHCSYEQERNSHGEDLDPWGTPYLIESDGNRVRMKSAGSNRKFDQVGSLDYDDICFSIAGGSVIGDDNKF
jgi:hypothetical protein